MYINDAEFFWGTTDPGEGNGISMLPIDRPVTLFSEYFDSTTFLLNWSGDTGSIRGNGVYMVELNIEHGSIFRYKWNQLLVF